MVESKSVSAVGRQIIVAVPTMDHQIHIKSAGALMESMAVLSNHGCKMGFIYAGGCSIVQKARNALLGTFINDMSEGTDILFLDADVIWRSEDLARMVAHAAIADVVCASYPKKEYPLTYQFTPKRVDGKLVVEDGLVEIERIGAGFMLVRRHVIEALWERHSNKSYLEVDGTIQRAIFDMLLTDEGYIGEDALFCDRVRELGYRIWLDPYIRLGHAGHHEFQGDFYNHVFLPEMRGEGEESGQGKIYRMPQHAA